MKNVDIRQLQLLCELVDAGSLAQAAQRMGMTSSAASQSLARLRPAFAADVYVRDGAAYRLTPYGEQVLTGARAIVHRWQSVLSHSEQFDPAQCELRFGLACVAHVAHPDLLKLHRTFRGFAPRAQLDLQVPLHNSVDILALRSGRLDVLCASAAPPEDVRDLHHELLCTFDLSHVVFREGHPRIGSSLTLAQYLAEEHLIAHYRNLDPATRSPLDATLLAAGLGMRRSIYVQSMWACVHMAAHTDHLLTMTAEGAKVLVGNVHGLRTLPLPDELTRVRSSLHMIWHERTHRSNAHLWLRGLVRHASGEEPARHQASGFNGVHG
ncbi:MAG: LysR family transcriptional regulator [Hydrogenophaga sp.]|uniref:LysR family transcriptional regulator n=1 Tax=Hydrogenophaga sp. TaxID=1904254 RepID=UPI001D75729C|nr:LysR family transcriptional regulator [Hydrogenophaga sp.]MBX3611492.1 LysR family transcriptional regulator [Hydrogenophaga sp.]